MPRDDTQTQPVYRVTGDLDGRRGIAEQLGVQPQSIYGLIHRGELRAVRIGTTIRVPQSAIDDFLEGR
ncbi:helix-turn-helix domain-containing protein [Raineyella fluvialis]|uniref:helix-turn-helix domain-containing protein n=1 Tax=Raineyella fluvialis TaxID=2662261 RepID=UPI0018903F64|nr:helix-turn-helix domain-containing protein [Raineyella fluvialis]